MGLLFRRSKVRTVSRVRQIRFHGLLHHPRRTQVRRRDSHLYHDVFWGIVIQQRTRTLSHGRKGTISQLGHRNGHAADLGARLVFRSSGLPHAEQGWGSGAGRGALGAFITNGLSQLGNLPAVVAFTFTKRLWLAIIIIVLEVGAVLGGIKMKQLEKELSSPRGRRRR